MYQVESSVSVLRGHRALFGGRFRKGVSRTVVLLGLTSLFTDISSEMVSTILPLFLVYSLGLTPLQFGFVDGIYQGGSAVARLVGGFYSDRTRRHKQVAAVGYGLSAVCKPLFLVVGSAWTVLGLLVFADRAGKGIRTAPRDAMISLSTPREHLGAAFGVHRALDTTGAMLGPLLAFGILWLVPEGFNSVFVVSFAFAVIGLAILMLFVEQPAGATPKNVEPVRVADALRLFAAVRFRTIVLVGGALAVFTASDGFIYLSLQDRLGFETGFFPLLYVGTAATYMLLAIPAGRLADHFGRGKVFLAGYGLLVLVYALVLAPSFGAGAVVAALLLFGAYYAATDGVLAAFASSVLPTDLRATGLAFLVTVTSIARLGASILFGAIWTAYGVEAALEFFAVSLGVSVIAAAVVLARLRPEAAHA